MTSAMEWRHKLGVAAMGVWLSANVFANLTLANRSQRGQRYTRPPLPRYGDEEDYVINTPGCYIPNAGTYINYYLAKESINNTCGRRMVTIKKVGDYKIRFDINKMVNGNDSTCCYRFAKRSTFKGQEDFQLTHSECKPFKHGDIVTLEHELIEVFCSSRDGLYLPPIGGMPVSLLDRLFLDDPFLIQNYRRHSSLPLESMPLHYRYEDAYLILKKILVNKPSDTDPSHWNILVVGMDTMSRTRALKQMPKVVEYLREQGWLDYRGYQKVGSNTFPNVMAVLSGLTQNNIEKCFKNTTDACRDQIIWNNFKEAGYVTAYGKDTKPFYTDYGFSKPPTDHYAYPMFIIEGTTIGNLECTKTRPSILRLLNYAAQFATTYKNNKFFGFFWTSYGHEYHHLPRLAQNMFIYLFEYLLQMDVLKNSFVIFLSDHGIGFGPNIKIKGADYDSKLPMLFMWVPHRFREQYPDEYYNLQRNQFRLTTPYDVHATLWTLLKFSNASVRVTPSEGCPDCEGLTKEISPTRTCADAHVDKEWCACDTAESNKNQTLEKTSLVKRPSQSNVTSVGTGSVERQRPEQLEHSVLGKPAVDTSTARTERAKNIIFD